MNRFRATWLVCIVALCLARHGESFTAQRGDKKQLEQAKHLLQAEQEQDVRRGAELCAAMNDVPAVELLLDVLRNDLRSSNAHLPPAHYRDVVWESLVKISDPYARARVASEIGQNRKNAWMREWCAEAVGVYGDVALGKALLSCLNDDVDAVRRASVRAAGALKLESAKPSLASLVRHKDPMTRADAIEALARLEPEKQKRNVEDALAKEKDGGVRCALLQVYAELWPGDADARAAAMLADEDWRPRLAALRILERSSSDASLNALIRASGDARAVIARRAIADLQKRTSVKLYTRAQWEKWSRDTKGGTENSGDAYPSEVEVPYTHALYNDLVITSDHVVFLLDHSAAMSAALKSKGTPKSAFAKNEIQRVLAELEGKIEFNLIAYAEKLTPFADKSRPLDSKSRAKAGDFLLGLTCEGSKDIWAALEAVMADPSVDTVYLLSSGEPEVGEYVHWNRVTMHLAELNRFHGLVIHTIAYGEETWYREQLQKIAEATGGEFKAIE